MAEDRPAEDLRAQDRTIRALMSLVDDLTVERDEEGLLRTTLEHVISHLGVEGGATFVNPESLVCRAQHGMADELVPAATALARTAIQESSPQVREHDDGTWLAAAPLASGKGALGAIALCGRGPGPGLDLLQAMGKQIGTGLVNLRLYGDLRVASARTEVLNRLISTLSAGLDLKGVMAAFAQELATLATFDRLACGFVNESGDYIEMTSHPEEALWGFGSVLPVVGSGPGVVILQNQAVVQADLVHHHRFIEDLKLLEDGVQSYVLLPLNSRGRSVGVLALGSTRRRAYDEASRDRLLPVADSVAVALENMRLVQRLREMSITDEVTPLYNYRFFHQMLDRELKLVDRYHSVLSVIFLDLDRFKPINDQWGHLRGSRVLREVGFLVRSAVRETDYPARYGGDEFVVILPQTDTQHARTLAEKLRRLIEGHTFLQEEGINARLGASLGVASYPADATSKESLIRLADERMYLDKQDRTRH